MFALPLDEGHEADEKEDRRRYVKEVVLRGGGGRRWASMHQLSRAAHETGALALTQQ